MAYNRVLNTPLKSPYLAQIDLAVDPQRKVELLRQHDYETGVVHHPSRYREMVNYTQDRWHYILVQRDAEEEEQTLRHDAVQKAYDARERLGLPLFFERQQLKRAYEKTIGDRAVRARTENEHGRWLDSRRGDPPAQ